MQHKFNDQQSSENILSDDNNKAMVSGSYHVNEAFSADKGDKDKHDEKDKGSNSGDDKKAILDEERGNWENKCDFFLSALGYAVGLGNVWRFPKLAYDHGGGSFLIPYTIMLLLAGLPLFFMELALGQYSGAGPTRLFGRMAPITKGLGFAMLAVTFYVCIYYNMIIAWSLFYFFAGMTDPLPWVDCGEDRPYCVQREFVNETVCNKTKSDDDDAPVLFNASLSPPEDYFNHDMLGYTPGEHNWSNFGHLQWKLVLCLFGAWVIVGASLVKGVQSSGKVVYFTAIFPFVVLFILFIQGIMLPGAIDGIEFYVKPNYEKLLDPEVWQDAATQIFYSLGPAFGGLITLASYNKFDNNCHRDAVLIAFCNCGTSVFAGFVVFSILGFMSHQTGLCIDKVVQAGPALAFVVFPEAVGNMVVPQLWSFLFFLMLITLGLDSMFTQVETITTALLDHFKSLRAHKEWVVVATSVAGFVLGLSMCSSAGIYMFTLIDKTCASWNILLFAFFEVATVSWLYGVERFFGDIREMGMRLPAPVKWYWKICWLVVTPLVLAVLVILKFVSVASGKGVDYAGYVFPPAVQGLGWLIGLSSVIFLPLLAVRQILKRKRSGKALGWALFKPTAKWLPAKA